jgi:hypothetical protein
MLGDANVDIAYVDGRAIAKLAKEDLEKPT